MAIEGPSSKYTRLGTMATGLGHVERPGADDRQGHDMDEYGQSAWLPVLLGYELGGRLMTYVGGGTVEG